MKTEFTSSAVNEPIQVSPGAVTEFDSSSEESPRAALQPVATGSYFPTNISNRQARAFGARPQASLRPLRAGVSTSGVLPFASRRLVLRGNPAVLRRLREAEMAAWEAAAPVRRPEKARIPSARVQLLQPETTVSSKAETRLLFAVAAAALTGVLLGLDNVYDLLAEWGRFAAGIQSLF